MSLCSHRCKAGVPGSAGMWQSAYPQALNFDQRGCLGVILNGAKNLSQADLITLF